MTSREDLVEELTIAARDLRAQRRFLKDSVESTTGFSFDALAHLYEKCIAALSPDERLIEALTLAANRLRAAAINEAPKQSREYYDYSQWADEAQAVVSTTKADQ